MGRKRIRVLLIDGDLISLEEVNKLLIQWNYRVIKCKLLEQAQKVLQKNETRIDLVMCDVKTTEDDATTGFKFIEQVSKKMKIPVIMMDSGWNNLTRGMMCGAWQYLHKPVEITDLKNIWHHVHRNRIMKGTTAAASSVHLRNLDDDYKIHMIMRDAPDQINMIISTSNEEAEDEIRDYCDQGESSSSITRRSRLVWTPDLHHKFVEAVNMLGVEHASPKQILELMGDPSLTRTNIASHLQKYRYGLNKRHKNNDAASPQLRMHFNSSIPPMSSDSWGNQLSQHRPMDPNQAAWDCIPELCQHKSMDLNQAAWDYCIPQLCQHGSMDPNRQVARDCIPQRCQYGSMDPNLEVARDCIPQLCQYGSMDPNLQVARDCIPELCQHRSTDPNIALQAAWRSYIPESNNGHHTNFNSKSYAAVCPCHDDLNNSCMSLEIPPLDLSDTLFSVIGPHIQPENFGNIVDFEIPNNAGDDDEHLFTS